MARSEAQSDPSRAGIKRPQDNLSKDTPPGSKPRGHKKAAHHNAIKLKVSPNAWHLMQRISTVYFFFQKPQSTTSSQNLSQHLKRTPSP